MGMEERGIGEDDFRISPLQGDDGVTAATWQRLQVSEPVFWYGAGAQGDLSPVTAPARTSL